MTLESTHGPIDWLDTPPTEFPQDTLYLGDRLDQILAALIDLKKGGVRSERPAPTIIELSQAEPTRRSSIRLRVERLVISDDPAVSGYTTLVVGGGRTYRLFGNPANGTQSIQFPIIIENGYDVTWAGMASTNSRLYIIGYTEDIG